MRLALLCTIVLTGFLASSCGDDGGCENSSYDCFDPCENVIRFQFWMEGPRAFYKEEVDTIQIIRFLKTNRAKTDTCELRFNPHRDFTYINTERSPVQGFDPDCIYTVPPGFVITWHTPFKDAVYDLYDYDIVVPGIKTFHVTHVLESGAVKRRPERCGVCYASDTNTLALDGFAYNAMHNNWIYLKK